MYIYICPSTWYVKLRRPQLSLSNFVCDGHSSHGHFPSALRHYDNSVRLTGCLADWLAAERSSNPLRSLSQGYHTTTNTTSAAAALAISYCLLCTDLLLAQTESRRSLGPLRPSVRLSVCPLANGRPQA